MKSVIYQRKKEFIGGRVLCDVKIYLNKLEKQKNDTISQNLVYSLVLRRKSNKINYLNLNVQLCNCMILFYIKHLFIYLK